MKHWFISYGCDNYTNSKKRIEAEAKQFGFDEVIIYSPDNLSKEFVEKTQPFINEPRGKGYWLWKAYIIKETFKLMDEGDILVYLDAGCSLNEYGKGTYNEWVNLLNNSDTGMIRFRYMETPEEWYTTEAVFEYFSKENDIEFRNKDIYMNGIIMYKKNTNSQNYIDKFYDITITRPDIFSDIYNHKHCDSFKDHRHDQSVSSCLVKLYDFISIDDHSYGNSYEMWMDLVFNMKQPFLATRIRN